MLKQITEKKLYIIIATIIGLYFLSWGLMKNSFPFIILGVAILGIQLIKIQSIKGKKDIDLPGEKAKGQWGER